MVKNSRSSLQSLYSTTSFCCWIQYFCNHLFYFHQLLDYTLCCIYMTFSLNYLAPIVLVVISYKTFFVKKINYSTHRITIVVAETQQNCNMVFIFTMAQLVYYGAQKYNYCKLLW